MILAPFKRDPSEVYSRQAEIAAFFMDWMEFHRARLLAKRRERRQARWTLNEAAPTDLPTLPYVPQIEPGPNSKYQMMSVE